MSKSKITRERLKEIFLFDEEKGIFYWKISPSNNIKVGDIAGKGSVKGYKRVSIDNSSYLIHRLVWLWHFGYIPDEIDHVNHDRSDNRLCNLREVTHIDNCRNESKKSNNTSGYNGVIWHKSAKKWSAQITVNRKNHYLGLFNTKEEALLARKEADIKYGFYSNHGN